MSSSSLSAGGMRWKEWNVQVQESASVWGDVYGQSDSGAWS